MRTKWASPYACLVVGYKEETKLFPIEVPKYFSTEEIQIVKEVFRRYMHDGFLLWPAMLNFGNFMVCLNNLHPSINNTYEKAKVARDEKGNLVQILNFLDTNVTSVKHGNLAKFLLETFKSIKKHTCKPQIFYPYPKNIPLTPLHT